MFQPILTDEEFRALTYLGRVDFLGPAIDAVYVIRWDATNNVAVGKFYGFDAAGEKTDSFEAVPFELRSTHYVAARDGEEDSILAAYSTLTAVCRSLVFDNYVNVKESEVIDPAQPLH